MVTKAGCAGVAGAAGAAGCAVGGCAAGGVVCASAAAPHASSNRVRTAIRIVASLRSSRVMVRRAAVLRGSRFALAPQDDGRPPNHAARILFVGMLLAIMAELKSPLVDAVPHSWPP